jgi:hypothetical protein
MFVSSSDEEVTGAGSGDGEAVSGSKLDRIDRDGVGEVL